jgi:hypothetical protein
MRVLIAREQAPNVRGGGKIGRLGAFENGIYVGCGSPEIIGRNDPVRYQPPVFHKESIWVDRGNAAPGGRRCPSSLFPVSGRALSSLRSDGDIS